MSFALVASVSELSYTFFAVILDTMADLVEIIKFWRIWLIIRNFIHDLACNITRNLGKFEEDERCVRTTQGASECLVSRYESRSLDSRDEVLVLREVQ